MWKLDDKEGGVLKNGCFRIVVLEKTLESSLHSKIKAVNPKGNQPWIFIGRTHVEAIAPILWPPVAKNQFIGKDSDSGKDWGQEEKGSTEDGITNTMTWVEFTRVLLWFIVRKIYACIYIWGGGVFPGGSVIKKPPAKAGDTGDGRDVCLIPGLGRSPGGGNGNPLKYSYLENSVDRGAWWATVHGVAKSQTQLSIHTHTHTHICVCVCIFGLYPNFWHRAPKTLGNSYEVVTAIYMSCAMLMRSLLESP